MLKSSHKTTKAAGEALQAPPQSELTGYIFSEETLQSLQALGVILRRIHNRLEAEKAAAIGVESPNNAIMKK